ncbi:hypothetical protein THII_0002 [Thioploca ingrica]|uniref:DUF29 domain-containing protein n=1 Tax=Thioploca ingrica TaxID=40754 RepID=A0A090ACA9_9GAMM|nr:hypothetical protein THII_0002 [Thioploca ingrica]
MNKSIDYETDFYAWAQYNADLLRQRQFSELDIEHLVEELESMGKRDRRELTSRFKILLAHLLKWQYQPSYRCSSWRGSIAEQRLQINDLIKANPSLKSYLPEAIIFAYPEALELASDETGLPQSIFPTTCTYSIEQLLDKNFVTT